MKSIGPLIDAVLPVMILFVLIVSVADLNPQDQAEENNPENSNTQEASSVEVHLEATITSNGIKICQVDSLGNRIDIRDIQGIEFEPGSQTKLIIPQLRSVLEKLNSCDTRVRLGA